MRPTLNPVRLESKVVAHCSQLLEIKYPHDVLIDLLKPATEYRTVHSWPEHQPKWMPFWVDLVVHSAGSLNFPYAIIWDNPITLRAIAVRLDVHPLIPVFWKLCIKICKIQTLEPPSEL